MKHYTLTMKMRLQPMHRAELEDILNKFLRGVKLGKVVGGGTLMKTSGEMIECDIELLLKKDADETINKLIEVIEVLGIAKNSKLYCKKKEYAIGNLEGLAIYLNGTELSKDVYASCDVNYATEELLKALGDEVKTYSFWEGNTETGLYFYGRSFDEMKLRIAKFVEEYPLCQKARIEQIV